MGCSERFRTADYRLMVRCECCAGNLRLALVVVEVAHAKFVSWGLQGRQVVQSFGLPPEAAGGPGFDAVGPGKGKVRVNGWDRAELWRRGWAC